MQILFVQVYLLCNSSTGGRKSTPLKCSLVVLHGGWEAWRMNQTPNYMAKQKAKKRQIANSDTDSENSYPASHPTNTSSSTSTKKTLCTQILIIHSEKEGDTISSLSPFVVHKTIMSIAGNQRG